MKYNVMVRYGAMGVVDRFSSELTGLKRGDRVVVRTDRGSEEGVVVESREADEGEEASGGDVLRLFTGQDEAELRRIQDEAIPAEKAFCRQRISELKLKMKLVDAEHLLGSEKIIFYFMADGRVDFRQLVKDIARQYRTRIELRQIGVRDEARLLAECGHCGQRMCCKSFIKSLEPVTMRMAKSQKATLDPSKISGVCGRLMCCLRYEDQQYRDLKANLPSKGCHLTCAAGEGKVVDMDVLGQTVTIQTASANRVRVDADDIVSVVRKKRERSQSGQGGGGNDDKKADAKPDAQKSPPGASGKTGSKKSPARPPRRRSRRGKRSGGSR